MTSFWSMEDRKGVFFLPNRPGGIAQPNYEITNRIWEV